MANLHKLPPELWLETFGHLRSPADLRAVVNTCSRLREIKNSKYWDMLKNKVEDQQTEDNLTPELVALWGLKTYNEDRRLTLMYRITLGPQVTQQHGPPVQKKA
ncbi:hypothetical protein TWF281_004426 [Arthrobotrys megalospora]